MKNLNLIFSLSCVLVISLSCENRILGTPETEMLDSALVYSEPLVYESLEDMQNAIFSGNNVVRSSTFVSYAETTMQEDGYSDLPWAINSERFGSVLNKDGEVIFGNTFLKLSKYGIIYAPIAKMDKARWYALHEESRESLIIAADIPSFLSTSDLSFSFVEDPDVFLYDSFGLVADKKQTLETKVLLPVNTEYIEYDYDQEDILVNNNQIKWKRNFNVANNANQKIDFTSNICNDTRIFQDNYGVYSESGVVAKTMKKNGLGVWVKFENPVNVGITDMILCEEGVNMSLAPPTSPEHIISDFVDVNKFKIDIAGELANKELILATVKNYSENTVLNMTYSQYQALKETIRNWAQENGLYLSRIDGIRFYVADLNRCYIRLDDREYSESAKDLRATMNYFWGGSRINGHESLLNTSFAWLNDIDGESHPYHVQKVTMYGNSEYDGSKKGSKLIYNYDHSKSFN